mgnify:CR=1 FL=1
MINVFVLQNGRLSQVNIDTREDLEKASPIWVDLTDPSDEERDWVREIYGVTLPDEDEVKDIEASARYYEADNGDLHLRSDFLLEEDEGESRVVTVAFILARDLLFSMHNDDLPVFRLVRLRARSRPGSIGDFKDVLLDLYATDVEYSADALEGIYLNLEEVSRSVLQKEFSDQDAAESLSAMAREEDLNGRIRRNMMDTRRAVSFLMRGRLLNSDQFDDARQILRDIESLDGHTAFLFDKINFLMDATVGFININQNKIKNLLIPFPSLETQKKIVQILDRKFAEWDTHQQELHNIQKRHELIKKHLSSITSSILNQAFIGKLVN